MQQYAYGRCPFPQHNYTQQTQRRHVGTLTFKRAELLYDCANMGYVEAELLDETEEHARHQTADITQDGNVNRVTRILNLAFAEIVELTAPYSQPPTATAEAPTLTDQLHEPDEYRLPLYAPRTFAASTVRLLQELIHEYIVDCVMADWLALSKPNAAANWMARQNATRTSIKDALQHRSGGSKVHRRLKPF